MSDAQHPENRPAQAPPSPVRAAPLEYASPKLEVRSIRRPIVTIAVVLVLILFGMSLLSVFIGTTRERVNRVNCASNLRSLGQGLLLYANDNRQAYPRTRYDPNKDPTCFTPAAPAGGMAPNESDPFFGRIRPADNDVTAALFLLVRNDVAPDVFICPATNHEKDTLNNVGATNRANFNSANNLSYSYANPYPKAGAVNLGYSLQPNAIATFAILADRNDGDLDNNLAANSASPRRTQRKLNSRNHGGDGQNVLYNDGHVDWVDDCWAGHQDDCIWGDAAAIQPGPPPAQAKPAQTSNGTDPKLPLDSILLPKKGYGLP